MNILFVNDTSNYHCGSFLTCEVLLKLINLKVNNVERISTGNFKYKNSISFYDLVIINGEGTFHHDYPNAKNIYNLAKKFKEEGKKVFLINTVIQDISFDLSIFDYISVRESNSSMGKYPIVQDPCFYKVIDNSDNKEEYVLFIDSVVKKVSDKIFDEFNKFKGPKKYIVMDNKISLNDFLKLCKNASCIITGRYHGVVFSIMCEKKFVAFESNTHKISGLLKDLNLLENLTDNFYDLDKKISLAVKPKINYNKIKNDLENMIDNCFKIYKL
jgi:hypothetical protein